MNLVQVTKLYISKMAEESGPGMKLLLMDKDTTSIVSTVYSQSEILQKEIYLFQRLDSGGPSEMMRHLKCICFLRPTKENIALLSRELKNPRYGAYYIYFSNVVAKAEVKALAESDEHECVRELQEAFADFVAVSPHLFSLGVHSCCQHQPHNGGAVWDERALARCARGVAAVLLALKKCPFIRYRHSSDMARRLADKIRELISKEESLFEWRGGGGEPPPLLLILDRRDDPVTPLLTQWTYQAMVHELLTINNNRVSLGPGQEVVLSALHDRFYADNQYLNYGEIGQTVKRLMDEFQSEAKSQHGRVHSIADMKAFVENYPQFKQMSGTVSKHVAVIGELAARVAQRHLLAVSEMEQELACQHQHSHQLQRLRQMLGAKGEVGDAEALRLVMLYALRYRRHTNNDITGLVDALRKRGVPQHELQMVHSVMEYGGRWQEAAPDLISQEAVVNITKRLFKDLKGVENVYTQHVPLLRDTLQDLIKGRLKESTHPFLGNAPPPSARRVQDVVVFVVGGVTYEESLAVHQLNRVGGGARLVLGGSLVHNAHSFLQEVCCAFPPTLTQS